jgi:hypothetical protein
VAHGGERDVVDAVRLERLVAQLEPHHAVGVGAHAQRVEVALLEQRRDGVREPLRLRAPARRRCRRTRWGTSRRWPGRQRAAEHGDGRRRRETSTSGAPSTCPSNVSMATTLSSGTAPRARLVRPSSA